MGARAAAGRLADQRAQRLGSQRHQDPQFWLLTALAWAWVTVPFLFGLYQLLIRIPALFDS
jgi:hypothetical protein